MPRVQQKDSCPAAKSRTVRKALHTMPIKRRKKPALITLVSILVILAIDQFSKTLVFQSLKIGESIPLIKNILHITFVSNTGAAFGLFKNSSLIFIVISIVAIVIISTIILRSIKKDEFLSSSMFNYGLILIISGAMGNLIDRLRFGYVVDFIDIRVWPVFNIADASITIGTLLLILSLFHPQTTWPWVNKIGTAVPIFLFCPKFWQNPKHMVYFILKKKSPFFIHIK